MDDAGSSSTITAISWPLTMWRNVPPRAITVYWFQSFMLDEVAERIAIADRAHQLLALRAEALDNLAAPREDAHRRVL